MHLDNMESSRRHFLRPLLLVVIVAFLALATVLATTRVEHDTRNQAEQAIRDSVIEAAVQCFAIEGAYPPDLSYLEKTYGLQVNHRDYIITYDCFASNVMPQIEVLSRED